MFSPVTPHIVGRFAPSPTGSLHIGSLVAAVGSYLLAKQQGGQWLLRLDDLDRPRQVPGADDDIMRTLEAFALQWDGAVTRQSQHLEAYAAAFSRLQEMGALYPCGCSRKDISHAASAPHGDEGPLYSGACRDALQGNGTIRSWRVRLPEQQLCFHDLRKGTVCQQYSGAAGDFVVRRGDGEFAYQLAVVVDDALTGVTQVVRGEDLLLATPRQLYLQQLLGIAHPRYCHLPVVTAADGAKLSKRNHLVSSCSGAFHGREGELLVKVLRFLGQQPPEQLHGAPCAEILSWAVDHVELERMPPAGGILTY